MFAGTHPVILAVGEREWTNSTIVLWLCFLSMRPTDPPSLWPIDGGERRVSRTEGARQLKREGGGGED